MKRKFGHERPLVARLAGGLCGFGALLSCGHALAQQVTISQVLRSAERDAAQLPFWLNRDDCLDEELTYTFSISISGFLSTDIFEVWVGDGSTCATNAERFPASGTTPRCYKVTPISGGGTPVTNYPPIVLSGSDVARAVHTIDDATCEDSTASQHSASINFMLIRTAGGDAIAADTYDQTDKFNVDVAGPAAPGSITAAPGETSVVVSFDSTGATTDIVKYYAYCAVADGSGGGAGGGGGGGAGGGGAATCTASGLVPGEIPSVAPCGEVTAPAGQVTATGLENGASYAVGIAAVDAVGNPGTLSELACATPSPVDDFFDAYRRAGGQAGGPLCSLGAGGVAWARDGALSLGSLGLLLGLGLLRRATRERRAREVAR